MFMRQIWIGALGQAEAGLLQPVGRIMSVNTTLIRINDFLKVYIQMFLSALLFLSQLKKFPSIRVRKISISSSSPNGIISILYISNVHLNKLSNQLITKNVSDRVLTLEEIIEITFNFRKDIIQGGGHFEFLILVSLFDLLRYFCCFKFKVMQIICVIAV